ncbi:MAG: sugar phosphate isomerase/epimerase [Capsulimonadaceae bacterium]|nr:sugar phosphate isomerase/epimerase [Capsulimonadaceae bacterium]
MRFGVCEGIHNLSIVADAGYDYVEFSVSGHLMPEKPEREVLPALAKALNAAAIRAEAFNCFLPGDLRVTGDGVDPARQAAYVRSALKRAAALGGKTVVFGSGAARNVPDGFDRSVAHRQIREFLARTADVAAANDIVIAIEPLHSGVCNIITGVAEAVEIAGQINHPAVQVLSDLFHVTHDSQSFEETASAGGQLRHVHISTPTTGKNPAAAELPVLTDYFRAIRKAGSVPRISLECGWTDLAAEAAPTLTVVRTAWEASKSQ